MRGPLCHPRSCLKGHSSAEDSLAVEESGRACLCLGEADERLEGEQPACQVLQREAKGVQDAWPFSSQQVLRQAIASGEGG